VAKKLTPLQRDVLIAIKVAQGVLALSPQTAIRERRAIGSLAYKGLIKRAWDEARQAYIYDLTAAGRAALDAESEAK
jgi:DNA-binding MarR family transcriptional regulator